MRHRGSKLMIFLSLLGAITFTLFILEESSQVVIFGTWPARSTRDFEHLLRGAELLSSINRAIRYVNYSIGWIQPLSFISYWKYSQALSYYTESLNKEILANSPELFIGKKVEITFTPQRIIKEGAKFRLINGRICVISSTLPKTRTIKITGTLRKEGDTLILIPDRISTCKKGEKN